MNTTRYDQSLGTKRKQRRLLTVPLMLFALLIALYGQNASAKPIHASAASPDQQTATQADKTPLKKKTAYGVYEGQADGHTVEISVYGEAVALQFKEKLEPYISRLETGDTVVFTYTEQKFIHDPQVLICNLLSIRELYMIK